MRVLASIPIACLSVAALLSGCGGGSSGGTATPAPPTLLVGVAATAPATNCPSGGITVNTGLDSNANGVLDATEISRSQYVCNGTAGTNGTNGVNGSNGSAGANGSNGSNGASALVKLTPEAAGANCANGGTRIDTGLDANANNTLDAAEVTSTAYVCGATGAVGAVGPAGPAGPTGPAGTNGSNGYTTLMSIGVEPNGANCTYGGSKVTAGLDNNRNGVLDGGEITSTNYVCNGAPSGLPWVSVTAASVAAQSNTGYLANNATSRVTVTLPAAPALGDVVRVSGPAAGGWKIAQRAGQSIQAHNLIVEAGVNWSALDSQHNWLAVASSADGRKLVATDQGSGVGTGGIYTSTDYGLNWVYRGLPNKGFVSVASSADGNKLVAVDSNAPGAIYTSSDSGVTWTARLTLMNWVSVASSSDGTKLVAAVSGGQIYTSTDSGVTWTARDSARAWKSLASSADGTKLAATTGGQFYTSSDSGVTWVPQPGMTAGAWSVASSADGSRLVVGLLSYYLYVSTDSGVTWTQVGLPGNWRAVASSADGMRLVAADEGPPLASGGRIATSSDGGLTWTYRGPTRVWNGLASSADGSRLAAVVTSTVGEIYASADQPVPVVQTTAGTAGGIFGDQFEAMELQFQGGGVWSVLSSSGAFDVR